MKKSVSFSSKSRWIPTLMVAATLAASSAFAGGETATRVGSWVLDEFAGLESAQLMRMESGQIEAQALRTLRSPEFKADAKSAYEGGKITREQYTAVLKLSASAASAGTLSGLLSTYSSDSGVTNFIGSLPQAGSVSAAASIVSAAKPSASTSASSASAPKPSTTSSAKTPAQIVAELAEKGGFGSQYKGLSSSEQAEIIDFARALGKRGMSEQEVTNAIRNRAIIEQKVAGSESVFGPLGSVCAATYPAESLEGLLARDQAAAIGATVKINGISAEESLSLFNKAYEVTFNVDETTAKASTCTLSIHCGDLNNRVVDLSGCGNG